jgi:hypothetical protein
MNATALLRYAGASIALAICSACGGGSTEMPPSAALNGTYIGRTLFVNGRPVTAARLNGPMPRYAMLVPERRAKRDFEYMFSDYGTYASIFDYPKSDQQIGTIPGDGGQGCTNVLYGFGKKIFWDVGGDNAITEYQVIKKPIKTLTDSNGSPSSCAMDASGDLAVGILSGSGGGDVDIFKNASGSATVYKTPLDAEFFDGYDDKGNLFADGFNRSGYFALVELPKGSSKFETIATSNAVEFPGSVQWDGTYLTVFDQYTAEIYRYTVSGTKATLKGRLSLRGSSDCAQTWIVTGLVFCADADNQDGEVFEYPQGGSIVATLTGKFDFPLGVTVSQR